MRSRRRPSVICDRCHKEVQAIAETGAPKAHKCPHGFECVKPLWSSHAVADCARCKMLRAIERVPDEALREPDECRSCDGYGHIREDGTGTVDRRERKCLDCNGSGKRAA